jgi:hypothetical protein
MMEQRDKAYEEVDTLRTRLAEAERESVKLAEALEFACRENEHVRTLLREAERQRDRHQRGAEDLLCQQTEIKAVLGLGAGGTGLSLAEEVRRIKAALMEAEQRGRAHREALAAAAGPLEILKATECDEAAVALHPAVKRMIVTAVDCVRAALSAPPPGTSPRS